MKQGEEFILQSKDRTVETVVFKATILENTSTTIYFQIEDGDRKRLLTGDFKKHYRIIEKIRGELETKID